MVALDELQALVSREQAECHQRMAVSHSSCGGSSTAGSCSDIGSSNSMGQRPQGIILSDCVDLQLSPSLAGEAQAFAAALGSGAASAEQCEPLAGASVLNSCLDLTPNLAKEARAYALAWSRDSAVASEFIDLPPSLADEARAFALGFAEQVSSVEGGGLLMGSDVTSSCLDLPPSLTEEARTFAMALESQAGPWTMLLGSGCSSGGSASPTPSTGGGASSSSVSPVGSSGDCSGCSIMASSISTSSSLELVSNAWSGICVRQAARLSLSSSSGGSGSSSSGGSSGGDRGAADRDSLPLYQASTLGHPPSSCSSSTGVTHALDLDAGMSDWSLELVVSAVGDLFEAEDEDTADSLPLFQAPASGHPLSCSSSAGVVHSMDIDAGMSDWSFEFSRCLFGAEGDTVAARLAGREARSPWLLMQCGSSMGQGVRQEGEGQVAYHDDAWEQGHGQGIGKAGCGEAKEGGSGRQDEDRAQEHLLAAKERELLLLLDEEEEQQQGLLEEYDAMAWLASGPSFELPSAAALQASDLTGVGSSRSSDGGASQSHVLSQASSLSLHCWARARIAAARGTDSSCGGSPNSGSTAGSCCGGVDISCDGSSDVSCGGSSGCSSSSLGSLGGSAGAGCNSMQLSSCGGASEHSWGSGVSSARSSSSQADSQTCAGTVGDDSVDGAADSIADGAAFAASAYGNLAAARHATLDLEAFLPMGLLDTCMCLASGHDVICSERDTLYGLSSSERAGMTGADFARVFLTTWLGGGPLPSSQLAEQLLERCLLE